MPGSASVIVHEPAAAIPLGCAVRVSEGTFPMCSPAAFPVVSGAATACVGPLTPRHPGRLPEVPRRWGAPSRLYLHTQARTLHVPDRPKHLPWFPFDVDAWNGSRAVRMMDAAARGVYVQALVEMWRHGPMPEDQSTWGPILGLDPQTVADALAGPLGGCFELTPAGWINETLEEVRTEQAVKFGRARESGRAGGRASVKNRYAQQQQQHSRGTNPTRVAQPTLEGSLDLPRSPSTSTSESTTQRKATPTALGGEQRLREFLGKRWGYVVDAGSVKFRSPLWALSVFGWFGPDGSRTRDAYGDEPRERWPDHLASGLLGVYAEGKEAPSQGPDLHPNFLASCIRTAVDAERERRAKEASRQADADLAGRQRAAAQRKAQQTIAEADARGRALTEREAELSEWHRDQPPEIRAKVAQEIQARLRTVNPGWSRKRAPEAAVRAFTIAVLSEFKDGGTQA